MRTPSPSTARRFIAWSTTSDVAPANPIVAGADYMTLPRLVETDPNTSAAWAATALNAATFGFKVG